MAEINENWIGNGICYGPHRDGQNPGGPQPTRAQLRDDLHLMRKHWQMFRMYAARGSTEIVLDLLREERLDMKLILGAWIVPELQLDENGNVIERFPEIAASNRAEVVTAIRLASEYPDQVLAIAVGNETQVHWSAHRVQTETLIDYIHQVREATKVPVSTADDLPYWRTPESERLADEVDFIFVHIHPMWCSQQLDNALAFVQEQYAVVSAQHPEHQIVIGETGWATQVHAEGHQARLIQGTPGEAEQKRFYEEYAAWIEEARIPSLLFEAFDERWKGSAHPNEVEKHWGLYFSDRTPKAVFSAGSDQK